MEDAKTAKRTSDRNQGETRLNGRAFTLVLPTDKCCEVRVKVVDNCFKLMRHQSKKKKKKKNLFRFYIFIDSFTICLWSAAFSRQALKFLPLWPFGHFLKLSCCVTSFSTGFRRWDSLTENIRQLDTLSRWNKGWRWTFKLFRQIRDSLFFRYWTIFLCCFKISFPHIFVRHRHIHNLCSKSWL